MSITIAIIQFPGSNCERETITAIQRCGMQAKAFLWNENPDNLKNFHGYVIVGGFSYEDRARAGIIAALDSVMTILRQQAVQGKPLLGICNGAQILIESGLVPGTEQTQAVLALGHNRRIKNGRILGTGYYNAWVYMKAHRHAHVFNQRLHHQIPLPIPVAHAEGRYMMSAELLQQLQQNGQIAFQYCDEQGLIQDEFPVNPNGSCANIAALTNRNGNVMAIMPHPERTLKGDRIFSAMRDYIIAGNYRRMQYFTWPQKKTTLNKYPIPKEAIAFTISSIVTDNHASSVQMALRARGIDVTIDRQIYWQMTTTEPTSLIQQSLEACGELWNPHKEYCHSIPDDNNTRSLLVFEQDDIVGQEKQQILKHHFGFHHIQNIRHGILWHIHFKHDIEQTMQAILDTHIFYNPCFH